MFIGSPQILRNVSNYQANISIDNKQIQQVNKSKALGTIVDQIYLGSLILKTYAKNNIRNLSSTSCKTIYC